MPSLLTLKNNLYQKKLFWSIRTWITEELLFRLGRLFYNLNEVGKEQRLSLQIFISGMQILTKSSFWASVVVLLIFGIDRLLPIPFEPDEEAIDSFLVTTASVSGVLLGLYFSALSGIASSYLIKASKAVRGLFISSPIGTRYVRLLVTIALTSLYFLVVKSLGGIITFWALLGIGLLSIYTISLFWAVGTSVFSGLEPQRALPIVYKRIITAIDRVCKANLYWRTRASQNHQRRVVAYNLDVIEDLLKFGIDTAKYSEGELLDILRNIVDCLDYYTKHKSSIPAESMWYDRTNLFEPWGMVDSHRREIALRTGTSIQATSGINRTWLEERIISIVVSIFTALLEKENKSAITQGYEIIIKSVDEAAQDLDVESTSLLLNSLRDFGVTLFQESQVAEDTNVLAFTDSLTRLPIEAVLGLTRSIEKNSVEQLIATFNNPNWANRNSIYRLATPSPMLQRLEQFAAHLRNEFNIEGRVISPQWYVHMICVEAYLHVLYEYYNYVRTLEANFYENILETLHKSNLARFKAHTLQRWIEYNSKFIRMVETLKQRQSILDAFHITKDVPWPTIDISEELSKAKTNETKTKQAYIELLPELSKVPFDKQWPDYFGHALHLAQHECFEACRASDLDRMKAVFNQTFISSWTYRDRMKLSLNDSLKDVEKENLSADYLVNLLEVCGYIKLFAELHSEPKLWEVVTAKWDEFLQQADEQQIGKYISALLRLRSSGFTSYPLDIQRTQWSMDFNRVLESQGLMNDRIMSFTARSTPVDHQSQVIRKICSSYAGLHGLNVGFKIFVVAYLRKHPMLQHIDYGNDLEGWSRTFDDEPEDDE